MEYDPIIWMYFANPKFHHQLTPIINLDEIHRHKKEIEMELLQKQRRMENKKMKNHYLNYWVIEDE